MTYSQARQAALQCNTYDELNALLDAIEENYYTITDRQYYAVKALGINAVYAHQTKGGK